MIGLVVATHGALGESLLETVTMIIGPPVRARAVSLSRDRDPLELRDQLTEAICEVGTDGNGVLLAVDMYGGTPANIGMTLLEPGRVDLLTGVNLPMLIKFFTYRGSCPLDELAELLKSYARDGIVLASEALHGPG
jgi:PTS system mannose-specific IIA component